MMAQWVGEVVLPHMPIFTTHQPISSKLTLLYVNYLASILALKNFNNTLVLTFHILYWILYYVLCSICIFQVFGERMLGLSVGVCISSVGVMAIVLFLLDNSSVT